ncbi:MAG: hypothetical protein GF363_16530, partial [Chitinivibrionales bacterium]|nr:hypothetical protein [Chitinivibrionales bacterium]
MLIPPTLLFLVGLLIHTYGIFAMVRSEISYWELWVHLSMAGVDAIAAY